MTRETACEPVGRSDRSDEEIDALQRLGDMLRERGWRPSEAQVCELARMLADRMPTASRSVRKV
ncbi:hypothetical protein [Aureimonas phyllosphaerae]|uniref:Uncharacterized protein n=1 Tax=Aureimonas phyllosphaerae TaxID=1166078 RepID=A0A7W6C321_9HYPH|nr:hypothetical protein [Aureimonas phyllosphaerae]MBB3937527.1 hypothetical protein [Aureimonas phyllosphaerae]MBB3961407.1 hypothetical protein [Aureimonas phyllosphaerae]